METWFSYVVRTIDFRYPSMDGAMAIAKEEDEGNWEHLEGGE
jgi:hypothetical protein